MKKKTIIAILIIAMTVIPLFGCKNDKVDDEKKDKPKAETVTIVDDTGSEHIINLPIKKVTPLDSSPYYVLSAFGKLDTVTGKQIAMENNELYKSIADQPTVATWSEINFEKLAELQPDVVISSVRSHGVVTDDEHLSNFNIADVKLDLRNPNNMKNGIEVMGKMFQCEDKAKVIINFYDKWEGFIEEKLKDVKEEDKPKVFVESHAGPFKTGGPDTRFYSQIERAGGINIARNLKVGEEPEVSAEWVSEQNPDFIVKEVSGIGYKAKDNTSVKDAYEEITSRAGLKNTKAIQQDNVFLVSVDMYSRPGYIVGVCYLAKEFYPEIFKDFNPDDVLKEYFEIFHPGAEIKGVYTYNGKQ